MGTSDLACSARCLTLPASTHDGAMRLANRKEIVVHASGSTAYTHVGSCKRFNRSHSCACKLSNHSISPTLPQYVHPLPPPVGAVQPLCRTNSSVFFFQNSCISAASILESSIHTLVPTNGLHMASQRWSWQATIGCTIDEFERCQHVDSAERLAFVGA